MNSRQIVKDTILFNNPPRLGYDLYGDFGSDFNYCPFFPSPEDKPTSGTDEWGAVWDNIGSSKIGKVVDFPFKDWCKLEKFVVPNILEEFRWEKVKSARRLTPDKYLMGYGISIYERVHVLRGLENTWIDIYADIDKLEKLIDILVDMNIKAIKKYGEYDYDGYYFWDDWGLQDRLMISPDKWRDIWMPRYKKIFAAAHDAGMNTFLHSCGYIIDIIDSLIEVGCDVLQMDQQMNMGLDELNKFSGRITFFSPVDIQAVMPGAKPQEIRNYCREMIEKLATCKGGFLPKFYIDIEGAGHTIENVNAMCDEFQLLANNYTDVVSSKKI